MSSRYENQYTNYSIPSNLITFAFPHFSHQNRHSGKGEKSGKNTKTQDASKPHETVDKAAGETSQDLMNEYSLANSETVVMSGNDMQMKIKRNSFPPQFVDIPPPPAFRQKTYKTDEPNSSNNRNEDHLQFNNNYTIANAKKSFMIQICGSKFN